MDVERVALLLHLPYDWNSILGIVCGTCMTNYAARRP